MADQPFSVEVHGLDELQRSLAAMSEGVEGEADRLAGRMADEGAQKGQGRVPHRTGGLAGSVATIDHGTVHRAVIGQGISYGRWVEFGGSRGRPLVPGGRYFMPAMKAEADTYKREAKALAKREAERF